MKQKGLPLRYEHENEMPSDYQAEDEFEKAAVKALKEGKPIHEAVEDSRYRFAGPIRLASRCVKWHVKHGSSTKDRTAGLLNSMPLKMKQ